MGQLLIETAHYSEQLEFEFVIYLSEFFIGKYNDLNIVWFWRFITSLQTLPHNEDEISRTVSKIESVKRYPVHEKYNRHFFLFSLVYHRIGQNSKDMNSVKKLKTVSRVVRFP